MVSESPTIDDFGSALRMSEQDIQNLRMVFISVEQGDIGILKALGMMVSLYYCSVKLV